VHSGDIAVPEAIRFVGRRLKQRFRFI